MKSVLSYLTKPNLNGFAFDSKAIVGSRARSLTPFLDSLAKKFHYDSSVVSSLSLAEASQVAVGDGGAVRRILDLSGNGYHLTTNGSASRAPTYRSASADCGGKPCLEFITDDILGAGSLTIPWVPLAIFWVGVLDSTQNWRGIFNVRIDNDYLRDIYAANAGTDTFFPGFAKQKNGHTPSAYHVRSGYMDLSTANNRIWRYNGTPVVDGGAPGPNLTGTNITQLTLGSRDLTTNALNAGMLCELVAVPVSELSFAQMVTVENELKAKWGI